MVMSPLQPSSELSSHLSPDGRLYVPGGGGFRRKEYVPSSSALDSGTDGKGKDKGNRKATAAMDMKTTTKTKVKVTNTAMATTSLSPPCERFANVRTTFHVTYYETVR